MKFYWATEANQFLVDDQDTGENVADILWTGHPYPALEAAQASCKFVTAWEEVRNRGVGTGRAWKGQNGDTEFLIREYEL
jgi:hypothetical protein